MDERIIDIAARLLGLRDDLGISVSDMAAFLEMKWLTPHGNSREG